MSRRSCLLAIVLLASQLPLGAQVEAQTCDAWQRLTPLPTITHLNAVASARTYNDSPAGSYGSFRTAVAPEDASCCMEQWVLILLSQSADPGSGFRTNLGFLNLEALPIELELSLYRANCQPLGSFTVELDGFEYSQLLRPLLSFAPEGVGDAFAVVRSPGRYLASASVVDNRSGDGVSIPAVLRPY